MSHQCDVNAYLLVDRKTKTSYRGVDRRPWGALVDLHRLGKLPRAIYERFLEITDVEYRYYWYPFLDSLTEARDWLELLNSNGLSVELIGVYSAYIEKVLHRDPYSEAQLRWFGYDVISTGAWSLLGSIAEFHDAIDSRLPPELAAVLSEDWLLKDAGGKDLVVDYHRGLVDECGLEALVDSGYKRIELLGVCGMNEPVEGLRP